MMIRPGPIKRIALTLFLFLCITPISPSQGLHGYIASYTNQAPSGYGEGFGFYSAIWPLIEEPVHWFQIGLPSTWITPDNTDNTTEPLCPIGTVARDNWPERGPTYASVFQTVEGGPGYWAGNKFHYGPPKFKMNSTPDCYNNQISTPGWQFFFSNDPLPDDLLGIAQIANHILIPPDGMTFEGNPNGDLLGITYMALPLTKPYTAGYPVGERNWTLFLNATNFKGPLAYYVPETWAKISKDYPFDYGRGLDARASVKNMAGGTMEFNTVPILRAKDDNQLQYAKIPRLQFPVDEQNRTILAKDVNFYSKTALYNDVLDWRNGGDAPAGSFKRRGTYPANMRTYPVTYRQDERIVEGINEVATPAIFTNNDFGLQWTGNVADGMGSFPQYYKDSADLRVAVPADQVPASTRLKIRQFNKPNPNPSPYMAELDGAWRTPGPVAGPYFAYLKDSSMVTYFWYRFIDQPVFQQFNWSQAKKDSLQNLIEQMHTNWTMDKTYMKDPSSGDLVSFDPGLFVTPPPEYTIGYVPIVIRQEKAEISSVEELPKPEVPWIKLYPNPVSDKLNIHLLSLPDWKHQVELVDLNGRVLQTVELDNNHKEIDVDHLPKGIYFVRVSSEEYVEKLKFLKL